MDSCVPEEGSETDARMIRLCATWVDREGTYLDVRTVEAHVYRIEPEADAFFLANGLRRWTVVVGAELERQLSPLQQPHRQADANTNSASDAPRTTTAARPSRLVQVDHRDEEAYLYFQIPVHENETREDAWARCEAAVKRTEDALCASGELAAIPTLRHLVLDDLTDPEYLLQALGARHLIPQDCLAPFRRIRSAKMYGWE